MTVSKINTYFFLALVVFCLFINNSVAQKPLDIAVVIPGFGNDKSFSQAAFEGLDPIQAQGHHVRYVENAAHWDPKRLEAHITSLCEARLDLLIVTGSEFSELINTIAKKHPEQKIAFISGHAEGKHVINYCLDCEPIGGRLAGELAAKATKSHIVGFVGGVKDIDGNEAIAFEETVKLNLPAAKILVSWTDDWFDQESARVLTEEQVKQGADVIIADANQAPLDIARKYPGVLVIGWMASLKDPQYVVGNVTLDLGALYKKIIEQFYETSFESQTIVIQEKDKVWQFNENSHLIASGPS